MRRKYQDEIHGWTGEDAKSMTSIDGNTRASNVLPVSSSFLALDLLIPIYLQCSPVGEYGEFATNFLFTSALLPNIRSL